MLPQPTAASNGLMRQKSMLLLGKLLRTKEPDIESEIDQKKVLTTSDLCSLGVGSCVGTGMYLVSGLVIRNYAGPAAIISFTIAAISSLLSGVCYAEFGVRIPQSTGTAYHYSYASVGEFIAFLIGWNLILEYMISTAAGASAISAAIDTLFNGRLSGFSNSAMDLVMRNDGTTTKASSVNLERPRSNKFASLSHQRESFNSQSNLTAFERYSMLFDGSTYRPDFMAAVLCILMTLVLISGVKKSVKFNNYLNLFNAAIFLFIVISALPLLSMKYWKADFYNNNLVTNNYLNRSRQIQPNVNTKTGYSGYRVPYQRGIVNRWEVENTNFDRHLIKRSIISINSKLNSVKNKNKLQNRIKNKNDNQNNLRARFENLFRQRLTRSLVNSEESRRKKSEHEANFAGFEDEDEDEDESIVTPAPRFTSTPKPVEPSSTTTMKIDLPTFRTMIRFTTSTTTLEPEEFYPEQPVYTLAPIEKTTEQPTTTTTTKATTTTTKATTTTIPSTTTEKATTTTTITSSSSTKRPFIHDSEEEEELTTKSVLEETTTESSYEEESSNKNEESEEQEVSQGIIGKIPLMRSTTEKSTQRVSTTPKPKSKSTKMKGKGKSKQVVKPEVSKHMENGFFQFGWQGVFRGAATCFYGFIGFDIISSTGGQTEQPTKSIPIAMVSASLITLSVYLITCLLISLTTPTNLVSSSTALVNIFDYHKMDFIKSIAACGAISSLTVAMFGSMFPLPRIVCAMAQDGLLWRKLAEINYYTGTTVFATLLLGTITSLLSLIFPLQVLVEIMSIGTLVAYTLISACILMLRYQPTKDNTNDQVPITNKNSLINCLPEQYRNEMIPEGERYYQQMMLNSNNNCNKITTDSNQEQKARKTKNKRNLRKFKSFNSSEDSDYDVSRNGSLMGHQARLQRDQSKDEDEEEDDEYLVDNDTNNNYNYGSVPYQYQYSSSGKRTQFEFLEKLMVYLFPYGFRVPGPATEESSFYVLKLLLLYFVLVILADTILAFGNLTIDKHLLCFILLILIVSLIFTLFTIGRQPQQKLNLKFKAPGVPYVPGLAILINIYLILKLSYLTLIRFMVWIIIGFFIYFLYSIKNSSLEQLYCNVSANDTYTEPNLYESSQYYQQSQPFDNYQQDSTNDQSIELKSRPKYIDSSTLSILTTTDSNPFLQTDLDTTAQFSKYGNIQLPDLSSIEEDTITEDATVDEQIEPEYDARKNPFLMDY